MLAAMRVLVLGATGFIGPAVMRALAALGHDPLGVARRPAESRALPVLAVDRNDAGAVARAAVAESAGVVVDLLAMTAASTAPLLHVLAGRVGRYVMASSGDVYRRYGALTRKEPDPDASRRLAEDAPLRATRHPYRAEPRRPPGDPAAWMDDYDKIPIEDAARAQADLPAVVARLPMVWGPGDRQRRFRWAIEPMLRNMPRLDMDEAWAAWRATYGYVDDVGHALALLATHPDAEGTYNVGAAEAPDHAHWAERFAAVIDWGGGFEHLSRREVPSPLRERLDALDLSRPMVIDTTKIRNELGFSEVVDPTDAMARNVVWEAEKFAR
jgi:nucleoside-diphosphate-sugar epimerase